ncbi:ATP-binding protein [Candidatus Gottesmanbacteria bacterium]|nr:ATP-binding protein [Candidatus Gottesmanbacteria bacterium]
MNNLIINDLVKQNPWWVDSQAKAIDPKKTHRNIFETLIERVIHRELITSLVGLRRVGKSTLVLQVVDHLLRAGQNPTTLLYFSFEELPEKDKGASLRAIIEYQLKKCPKEKSYLFFDEIQYVDRWNSVLKHYVDHYAQLKFTISGSASLFIASTAHETLAGRIQELVLRPMGYGEYLRINDKPNTPEYFLHYLSWGEFPYLEKLPDWAEKKEYVNDFIIKKVVEHDLPRLKRVYGNDIVNLLNVLITHSGQMVEIQNLAHDLHLAQNTVREYLHLLEKTYVVSQNFNLGIGFRTRSVRQRKVYATSVNALVLKTVQGLQSDLWQHNAGAMIETFVYNYLLRKNEGEIHFWRKRQIKEVDFIYSTPETKLPIEVKYQNQIRPSDLNNLLYYCSKEHLKKAMVVTKNEQGTKHIHGVEINFTPASTLL